MEIGVVDHTDCHQIDPISEQIRGVYEKKKAVEIRNMSKPFRRQHY